MVFDYIDGAAGDESTARRNRSVFEQFHLVPDVLVDVSQRSLQCELFGQPVSMPVVIGPTGLNGAFWPLGDLCLACAAKAENIPFVMSTAATVGLDDLVAHAGPLRWFQLYMLKDRGMVKAFLERVQASGFHVLELTVDTTVAGRRNRDIRNAFTLPFQWDAKKIWDTVRCPQWALGMLRHGSPTLKLFSEILGAVPTGATISEVMAQQLSNSFTWADIAWLRERWVGPLVLKGIYTTDHARRAIAAGIDGIVVSNHGGRQLDGSGSTLEALHQVVAAVDGRITVLADSGFRSGTDIAKALAMGADAVQLGRATLFGLAAGGEKGVGHALGILAQELDRSMALCGARSPLQLRGRIRRVDRV